jgi:hypothetical protein
LCFDRGFLTGADLVKIASQVEFLAPATVVLDDKLPWGTTFEPKHFAEIAASGHPAHFVLAPDERLAHDDGPFIHLIQNRRFQCLYLQFARFDGDSLELLDDLVCKREFRSGLLHSSEDTFWQLEKDPDYYVQCGRPHEHLPQIWDDDLRKSVVDISHNPARRHNVFDMWVQAAWRMWFGEAAFKHVPKEVLLSFRDAEEITTLPCGTIFVELFKDPYAFDTPENRRRQQAFLDHIGIDAIVQKAQQG